MWYYFIVPLLFYLTNVVQPSKVGPFSPTPTVLRFLTRMGKGEKRAHL